MSRSLSRDKKAPQTRHFLLKFSRMTFHHHSSREIDYTSCDAGSYRSIGVHFSSQLTMYRKILKPAATNKTFGNKFCP